MLQTTAHTVNVQKLFTYVDDYHSHMQANLCNYCDSNTPKQLTQQMSDQQVMCQLLCRKWCNCFNGDIEPRFHCVTS